MLILAFVFTYSVPREASLYCDLQSTGKRQYDNKTVYIFKLNNLLLPFFFFFNQRLTYKKKKSLFPLYNITELFRWKMIFFSILFSHLYCMKLDPHAQRSGKETFFLQFTSSGGQGKWKKWNYSITCNSGQ